MQSIAYHLSLQPLPEPKFQRAGVHKPNPSRHARRIPNQAAQRQRTAAPIAGHRARQANIRNRRFSRVSKPLIIGIAGGSGSGKSTVARNVADALTSLSVAFIDMDAYYRNFTTLPLEERRKVNWDHPDAFDFDLLTNHLSRLAARKAIQKPIYDFISHLRSEDAVAVEPSDVIVIDGILLFVDQRVRDLCDVKVFVDADADVRLIRRLERDISSRGRPLDEIIEQYLSTVQPMHLQFVEPSKRYADIIVPRGGHNSIAIEMIAAKIRQRLGHSTPGLTAP